jgi:hypothetical protein
MRAVIVSKYGGSPHVEDVPAKSMSVEASSRKRAATADPEAREFLRKADPGDHLASPGPIRRAFAVAGRAARR